MKKALLLLSIILVFGCLRTATVSDVEVSPEGVKIVSFTVDKNPVQSQELIGFLLKTQNTGEMPAEDVCLCIKRKGGFDFPRTALCPSCASHDLNAPDARVGMPGQTHESYWQVRAPEVQFPIEQPITSEVSYRYSTVATKEIPILTKDRLDELRESTAELYKGASTLTKSPIKIEIQAKDPVQVDLSGTKVFPFDIVLTNIGKGYVRRTEAMKLGWCGNETLNCIDSLKVELLGNNANRDYIECEPAEPTVAFWHFNEGTVGESAGEGDTVSDATGDNDGTIHGNPQWVDGKYGTALKLDGIDDYIDLGNDPSLRGTGPLSAEAWIKVDSIIPTNDTIVGKGFSWQFGVTNTSGNVTACFRRWNDYAALCTANTFPLSEWHHVAFTLSTASSNNLNLYVDGVLDNTGTITTPLDTSGTNAEISGYIRDDINYFNGTIDEVRITNRAPSPDEFFPRELSRTGIHLWQGKEARVKCRMFADLNIENGMASERYPVITATADYKYNIEGTITMEVLP